MCLDRGLTSGVLAKKLKDLADKGEIPTTLTEMTDVLRTLGNIGSHAADEEVTSEFVEVIDDFFRAVVEYVYVAPWKVSECKNRLAAAKMQDSNKGPSGGKSSC